MVVNTVTALPFFGGRKGDVNIRGAFLHMAADAAVSVGVVAAGLGIRWTGAAWIDPVASLAIAAVIFGGAWGLLRESFDLSMQAVPEGIDVPGIRDYLAGQPGVDAVHDLHVWALGTTETALTVHLVRPQVADDGRMLKRLQRELHDRFGIGHVTVQVERTADPGFCRQSDPEAL